LDAWLSRAVLVSTGSRAATSSGSQNKFEALARPTETRLAVAVVLVAFVLVTLLMFNSMFRAAPSQALVRHPQDLPQASGANGALRADAQTPDSTTASVNTANQTARMNQTPASQIDLSMIDRITGSGSSSIIFFKDGSTMPLDPYTMEQLPRDVQLRVSYVQGPRQSQPPETRRPPGAANAR
jgi:hypothetical protein